ncbi:MAG: hypothetical protein DIU74_002040 [Pseudomonadota bacterium]
MRNVIRSFVAGLCLAAATGAWAQEKLVADGEAWMQSSERERMAFLVGVTNMIAVEKAYAQRKGLPEPPAGALLARQTGDLTVEEMSKRITRWYEANPGQRKTPVMKVVWIDMVRPGLAKEKP